MYKFHELRLNLMIEQSHSKVDHEAGHHNQRQHLSLWKIQFSYFKIFENMYYMICLFVNMCQ